MEVLSAIEEVVQGVYRVEVPLPGNPLKSVNSYYVPGGGGRNLIVDTGMNRPECREAHSAAVKALGFDLNETDFFITHFHADHIGLITEMAAESSKVYFSRPEAAFLLAMGGAEGFWRKAALRGMAAGFSEEEVMDSVRRHPGQKYVPATYPPFTDVVEGDVIEAGGYRLECVVTPGHTFYHMCLYERAHKFLISGDHILGDITPNISGWSQDDDPLGSYLANLDKVDAMDVELVLPAHRRVFRNIHERIGELKHHHAERAAEALDILKAGPRSPYEVAGKMSWDIKAESWEKFPIMQKWFAVGEALAHLLYLEHQGLVGKEVRDLAGKSVEFYRAV
jgi:glyoxylase-like metal-dependent hydrolase (beta-lactamase superfamily II)